jgi:hypothetical protein
MLIFRGINAKNSCIAETDQHRTIYTCTNYVLTIQERLTLRENIIFNSFFFFVLCLVPNAAFVTGCPLMTENPLTNKKGSTTWLLKHVEPGAYFILIQSYSMHDNHCETIILRRQLWSINLRENRRVSH